MGEVIDHRSSMMNWMCLDVPGSSHHSQLTESPVHYFVIGEFDSVILHLFKFIVS